MERDKDLEGVGNVLLNLDLDLREMKLEFGILLGWKVIEVVEEREC